MAKYKCIVEYEYPVDHKPPVKAEIILHGDSVTSTNVTPFTDRPHGEWKKVGGIFYRLKCSNCNFELKSPDDKNNFCPNCGADMREGEVNENVGRRISRADEEPYN